MSSYRILLVHNRYRNYGGEDAVFDAEAELLRQQGNEVETYIRDNQDIHQPLAAASEALWSHRTVKEIDALAATFKPNLIHVHNTFPLISPSIFWAAEKNKIPIIQTLHNYRLICPQAMLLRNGQICEDCVGGFAWKGILRKCYRDSAAQTAAVAGSVGLHGMLGTYSNKVTRFIATDEFCREKFIEGGLPSEKIQVKPHFVPKAEVSASHRKGGIFVGRLSKEKGISVLSDALKIQEAPLRVVGSGPDESLLRNIPGVELLGFLSRKEIYSQLASAAWLVAPSISYETFGLSIVEAFACGTPAIVSRIGALKSLIEDGVTGLLVEPGNPRDLSEKIQWAQNHPAEMARMGKAAHEKYVAKYTPEKNYERLKEIYENVLSK
ncbi:glycosyltransferase family 4 protein [bacterium]|nr:glycosyltransferase family 4 protein [bacterium]